MSLKCKNKSCSTQIVSIQQLVFRQDAINGGWNLTLNSDYSYEENRLPSTVFIVDLSNNKHSVGDVNCKNCHGKLGIISRICGFEDISLNFSSKSVGLYTSAYSYQPINLKHKEKWSEIIKKLDSSNVNIPQLKGSLISKSTQLVGSNTIHFHGVKDFPSMLSAGKMVEKKSSLTPKDSQWRSFFFSCVNNTLLCLPTGFGKTLIAQMLMKAYRELNPNSIQVFVVPTIVLVEQQGASIKKNTGLKVQQRSGEHGEQAPWKMDEIAVCTPAMLIQAFEFGEILMSQIALLVLDEAHEAINTNSDYGKVVQKLIDCLPHQRPRVLGMTASPSGTNQLDVNTTIENLCKKLYAKPFIPSQYRDEFNQKVNCRFIEIHKNSFEVDYEKFVFTVFNSLGELDDYFKSYNFNYHDNFPTQSKISESLTIIARTRNLALQENLHKLLEISMIMKKWIDSLDFLRIFGPMKLISDIKKDMECQHTKDKFKELNADHIKQLINSEIMRFESIFESYHPNSSGFDTLLKEIERHSKTRILIFVQKRFTAERLCRSLQENEVTKSMNPDYIVGNTEGDFPKELQEEKLKKFRSGKIQLLVATSVLEQGIDVASCGSVICFDGKDSLKSIIQSRGRARENLANFVVFVSPHRSRKMNQLSNLEYTVEHVIQNLMIKYDSKFEASFDNEINNFLNGAEEEVEPSKFETVCKSDESSDDDDEDTISLRFFDFNNSQGIIDIISEITDWKKFRIKVKKTNITSNFTINPTENSSDKLSKMIRKFSTKAVERGISTWIENQSIETLSNNIFDELTIEFDKLNGYYFENPSTILFDKNSIWEGKIVMNMKKSYIKLEHGHTSIIIEREYLDDIILINETENTLEIYFCLRCPPTFKVEGQTYPYDFTRTSFNLCLTRFHTFEPMERLHSTLSYFTINSYYIVNPSVKYVYYESNEIIKDFKKSFLINQWHSQHASILPPILPQNIINQLLKIPSDELLEMILQNTIPVRFRKLRIANALSENYQLPFGEVYTNRTDYFKVGRVRVTPSRLNFLPFSEIQKNRIFRYFPNEENFVIVEFSSDQDNFTWKSDHVASHFLSVLKNGFKICGRLYTFLGCSNSQLREGRCWFSCLNRQQVYDKIGDLSKFTNPGRKLTRLALAFASSTETIDLDHEKYLKNVEDDIESGNINFSDGIGKASIEVFQQISRKLNLSTIPSAFQIRVGGVKGVISNFHQEQDVVFRKSMKKFESQHNKLEVLDFSRSIPLYLNRHVILMLSNFGVDDEVFLNMQQNDLMRCLNALISTSECVQLDFVKLQSSVIDWDSFSDHSQRQIIKEPFFQQILFNQVINLVNDLVEHAQIYVEKGRVLMGVLDETGTLDYGEVYVHIVESNFDLTLNGQVLVFRNPCVLPSDIRYLRARSNVPGNFKSLYKNVIVIPSKGKDSHARECAGGDLDGDQYYVIWDDKLFPSNLTPPGRDVIEVDTKELQKSQIDENSDFEMMKFYCDYQQQNQLGVIANAHLALSDQFGIESDQAIQIARYVVAETDAPKKGFTVGHVKNLMPEKYPHYMKKSVRDKYNSNTVVGKLFNQAFSIIEIILERSVSRLPKDFFSSSINTNAIEYWYSLYCFEIKKIIESFELTCEVDLFSGAPLWQHSKVSNFKRRIQQKSNVLKTMKTFWELWNKRFNDWRVRVQNNQQKIYEWYEYPKSHRWPAESFSFLAFPFITFDTFQKVSIIDNIQFSSRLWIHLNKLYWISEWCRRNDVGKEVSKRISPSICHFYGSSLLGLSEEFSDIDIFTNAHLDNLPPILMALDLNCTRFKKPNDSVKLIYGSCSIEITNFQPGVQKTYTIAEIFDNKPVLWSSLRVLLEWARNVRLVKSGKCQGIMTVVAFCMLFIEISLNSEITIIEEEKPYSIERLKTWIESSTENECGELILNFLQVLSDRKKKNFIASRRDPITNDHLIRTDLIDNLRQFAETALFILATHDGNVQKLFKYSTKYRLFKVNKRLADPAESTKANLDQILSDIKKKSNLEKLSQININFIEKSGFYYLEVVSNNPTEFVNIEKTLSRIHSKVACCSYSKSRVSHYHITNSSLIIPEFSYGPRTEVTFSIYLGTNYHSHHVHRLRAVLEIRSQNLNHNWKQTEYANYRAKMISQIKLYCDSVKDIQKHKGTPMWRLFGKMRCIIRTGDHYFFNVPDSLINTFEALEIQRVEKMISAYEVNVQMQNIRDSIIDFRRNKNIVLHEVLPKPKQTSTGEPLKLMPIQEIKKSLNAKRMRQSNIDIAANATKKIGGLRSSFYTGIHKTPEEVNFFANQIGMVHDIVHDLVPFKATFSLTFRSREILITTDNYGKIIDIHHRKVRWISATLKRYEKQSHDDVRIYLEAKQTLDEDENCLNTVKQYLSDRSVFTKNFVNLMNQEDINIEDLPNDPIIPEIFNFNWKICSLRFGKCIKRYLNSNNDALDYYTVFEGIFNANSLIDWVDKRKELEIELNMSSRTTVELSKDSYETAMKLFDFIKN